MPLETVMSVNILSSSVKPVNFVESFGGSSSRSEESISPVSNLGCCCGVAAACGGTSLPATSANPNGCGVAVAERRLMGLRCVLRGETGV